jgi:hypothetical protein
MGSLSRILTRLHRVFEKDPKRTAIIHISAPAGTTLRIHERRLSVMTAGTTTALDIGLTTGSDNDEIYTVTNLVDVINTMAGFIATLLQPDYGPFIAGGLIEDDWHSIADDSHLYYSTNPLWAELQPTTWMLDEQAQRLRTAEEQLYLDSAAGEWLDLWGNKYFKVPRLPGENDSDYAQRIIYETIRPNQNNIALELILQDALGVSATIIDVWPVRDGLAPEGQARAPGHFLLEMGIPNDLDAAAAQALIDKCYDVVRRHKAGGTDFMDTVLRELVNKLEALVLTEALAAIITVTLAETLLPGPVHVGAGWLVGTPGLVVGDNEALKEQILVQQIIAATETVDSFDLYGG